MTLWLTMLGINLFVAGLMIGTGLFLTRATLAYHAGGKQRVGYLTAAAQKNADTWEFANRYCGRTILTVGRVALPAAAIAMLPALPRFGRSDAFVENWGAVVGTGLALVFLVVIFMTERALRTTFTRQGTRKSGAAKPSTPTRRTHQTRRTRR
jgi:hypothetical protein